MSKPKEKNNTNKEYLITSANLGNVFWEETKLAIGLISQSLSSEENFLWHQGVVGRQRQHAIMGRTSDFGVREIPCLKCSMTCCGKEKTHL